MIVIDTESELYQPCVQIAASIIGVGASLIVRTFCNNVMDSRYPTGSTRALMKAGRFGLETLTMVDVSSIMKDQIDDWVEAYNDFATTYNQAKAVENANQMR